MHPLYRAEREIVTAHVRRRFEVERSYRSERPLCFERPRADCRKRELLTSKTAALARPVLILLRKTTSRRGTLKKKGVRTTRSMSNPYGVYLTPVSNERAVKSPT